MYNITIKSDAGTEPISEATIKNFIKYDENDATEILLILSMLKAARELIEKYLNVSLVSKTYQLSFNYMAVDDGYLKVPYGPVKEISSITGYDNAGDDTELESGTDYYTRGTQWPEIYLPTLSLDYYVMEWVSGYGTGTEALPDVLKNAICETVKYWYDREDGERILPQCVIGKIAPFNHNTWI